MTWRSRYDTWLRIIFWITNLIMIVAVAMLLRDGDAASLAVAVFGAAVLAGALWMQFATYYRLEGETLLVRCGPLRWTIPVASITSVTPTDDPTAGPALSLQRVRVEFTKNGRADEIFISPDDRDGFIAELRKTSGAGAVPPRA
jgi:hypothetical protein